MGYISLKICLILIIKFTISRGNILQIRISSSKDYVRSGNSIFILYLTSVKISTDYFQSFKFDRCVLPSPRLNYPYSYVSGVSSVLSSSKRSEVCLGKEKKKAEDNRKLENMDNKFACCVTENLTCDEQNLEIICNTQTENK